MKLRVEVTLLAALCCGPRSAPTPPVPPEPEPRSESASAAAADDEGEHEPRSPVDVASLAAGNGIVFVRVQDTCEAWQFVDDGGRLELVDDESLDLRLSFAVTIREPTEVTLADPRGTSRGESVTVECADEPANDEILFAEESDCRAKTRAVKIKRGCPSALLIADRRAELLHRLEAQRSAILDARRERAPAQLAKFKRSLARSKAVYWRGSTDTACAKWAVRKDRLVHAAAGGGTVSYGMTPALDGRTGLVQASMTGPEWNNGDSEGGVGSWELRPITEVEDDFAIVGGERWYFSRRACEAAGDPR